MFCVIVLVLLLCNSLLSQAIVARTLLKKLLLNDAFLVKYIKKLQFLIYVVNALFKDFTWKCSQLLFQEFQGQWGRLIVNSNSRASVANLNLHRFKSKFSKLDKDYFLKVIVSALVLTLTKSDI